MSEWFCLEGVNPSELCSTLNLSAPSSEGKHCSTAPITARHLCIFVKYSGSMVLFSAGGLICILTSSCSGARKHSRGQQIITFLFLLVCSGHFHEHVQQAGQFPGGWEARWDQNRNKKRWTSDIFLFFCAVGTAAALAATLDTALGAFCSMCSIRSAATLLTNTDCLRWPQGQPCLAVRSR